jgi:purine-binding chemotaxis protein CheW
MSTEIVSVSKAYLTFSLGDETFVAPVVRVREILELSKITKVPNAPDYMRGIVNLRGSVLPVVDTRLKFGLPPVADTPKSRIIVLEIKTKEREKSVFIGALVDAARDVIELSEEQILPPPSMDDYQKAEFIEGIVEDKGEFIMLIKVDKVFSKKEVAEMLQQQNNDS